MQFVHILTKVHLQNVSDFLNYLNALKNFGGLKPSQTLEKNKQTTY